MSTIADDNDARHLQPGLVLPDVALPSTLGGEVSLARLSGTAVVYVYPWTGQPGTPNPPDWDNIPGAHGSTPEAEGFRDLYASFVAADIAVYGLSTQSSAYQQEFVDRLTLPFALLSDDEFAFQQALNLPTFETGGLRYLKRLTLIANAGRLVRCIYPVANPVTHAQDLKQVLIDAT